MPFSLSEHKANVSTVLAGFESRLYACAIDMILLGVVGVLLHIASSGLIFVCIQAVYFIYFWYYGKGKTVGNRLLRIQVVSEKGSVLTLRQAIFRFIYFFLTIITIVGCFFIFFTKQKQGLHDKLAHTLVIKTS